ncbi:MAG: peptide-methionine (S)-S-oxide reductase MsrA [Gammaproteobacteria bacterium]
MDNENNNSGGGKAGTEKAVLAAGCFWGVEATLRGTEGVVDARVGYTGGHLDNATYEQVCTGKSGHAEAVEVLFDPARISYSQLLNAFWQLHDPTQLNRQGADIGDQYRSAIFYDNDGQRQLAEESLAEQQQQSKHPVVTQIRPLGVFWNAEDYHQNYVQKRGGWL